jgi:hypothetical protein
MKVLFINHFKSPDYLNDMVYHGLIDGGHDVYETAPPRYMLASHPNPSSLYGRGFSLFARLTHTPKVESVNEIFEKIVDRFYDIVIFGSVHRDLSYFDVVANMYPRERVHFIDGEDSTKILDGLIGCGRYWKRECVDESTDPITFAIPESQLLRSPVIKSKLFGTIIPGKVETYIFNNEKDYYEDYASSYYGLTFKKAGWDCMRHYEILANRCIPYFPHLSQCPPRTLCSFPKELILETNKYAANSKIHPNYDEINLELFNYTCRHLTTKKLVDSILFR